MQCQEGLRRTVCGARNAFNPTLALTATFGTTRYVREEDVKRAPFGVKSQTRHLAEAAANGKLGEGFAVRGTVYGQDGVPQYSQKESAIRRPSAPVYRAIRTNSPRNSAPEFVFNDSEEWKLAISYIRHRVDLHRKAARSAGHSGNKEVDTAEEGDESFDYKARVIKPRRSPIAPATPVPWAVPADAIKKFKNGQTVLELEIKRFAAYMELTPSERVARLNVIQEMRAFLKRTFQSGTTGWEQFGSETTGLALPLSDIDFRLFDTTGREDQTPDKMFGRIGRLFDALSESDQFFAPVFRGGRYPILNCQHRASGIDIQIVCSTPNQPQQQVIAQYIADTPHLKELFVLVRTMLSMRGLLDVYAGGLGSYGTFISLAAALKYRPPAPEEAERISTAFSRFLSFYPKLDLSRHGIAVHPRPRFLKHDRDPQYVAHSRAALRRGDAIRAAQWLICQRRWRQPYVLCLQDPANPRNDLGRKTHAIKHIVETLRFLRQNLGQRCRHISELNAEGKDWDGESLLLEVVGRCHEVYAERRRKLQRYGEEVVAERVQGEDLTKVFASSNVSEQMVNT